MFMLYNIIASFLLFFAHISTQEKLKFKKGIHIFYLLLEKWVLYHPMVFHPLQTGVLNEEDTCLHPSLEKSKDAHLQEVLSSVQRTTIKFKKKSQQLGVHISKYLAGA